MRACARACVHTSACSGPRADSALQSQPPPSMYTQDLCVWACCRRCTPRTCVYGRRCTPRTCLYHYGPTPIMAAVDVHPKLVCMDMPHGCGTDSRLRPKSREPARVLSTSSVDMPTAARRVRCPTVSKILSRDDGVDRAAGHPMRHGAEQAVSGVARCGIIDGAVGPSIRSPSRR